jgi:hypothetical protein
MARKISQGPDAYGFHPSHDGKESVAIYLMRALESGDKSKERLRVEYRYDFNRARGASEVTGTFDISFDDVVNLSATPISLALSSFWRTHLRITCLWICRELKQRKLALSLLHGVGHARLVQHTIVLVQIQYRHDVRTGRQ